MVKVKICGVTEVSNAVDVAACNVDYLGLNFFDKSKRCVDLTVARKIVEALPDNVKRVGLFVDAELEKVQSIVKELKLDVVQLHGDEDLSYIQCLREVAVWKALRLRDKSSAEGAFKFKDRVEKLVLDAFVPGEHGGTGVRIDESVLEVCGELMPDALIAGGLTVSNVGEIVSRYRPYGIDVASGVETSPGIKNIQLVSEFAQTARNS